MEVKWTIDTLKVHFEGILAEKDKYYERVFAEKDKALNAALSTAKEAVGVAETNAEKWRANANEWRGAMSDREKNFMPRSEFEAYKISSEKALALEKERGDKGEGKSAGINWVIGVLIAAAGIVGTLIGFFIKK